MDDNGYLWYVSRNGYIGAKVGNRWYSSDVLAKNYYRLNKVTFFDDNLWICSSKGVIRATPTPTTFAVVQFNEFMETFGDYPPQTEVTDIAFHNDTVFVATPLGLAFASIEDNLVNPAVWETTAVWDISADSSDTSYDSRGVSRLEVHKDTLWILAIKEQSEQDIVYYFMDGSIHKLELAIPFSVWETHNIISMDDTLWLLNPGGVYYYSESNNVFSRKNSDAPLQGGFGLAMINDKKFCATGYGMGVFEMDNNIRVTLFETIFGTAISDVVFADSLTIVSTSSEAINIFDGADWYFMDYYKFLPYIEEETDDIKAAVYGVFGDLRSAIVTPDGTMWLGSYGNGILKIFPDLTFEVWDTTNSALHTSVPGLNFPIANRFRIDSYGNLWVMCYVSQDEAPIKVWTPENYDDPYGAVSFDTSCGIPDKAVRAIACGMDRVGVATANGAGIIIHKGTIPNKSDDVYISLKGLLLNDEVNAVAITPDNRVWFGTMDGLSYWDPAGYLVDVPMPDDLSATIMSLCADSSGNVWIGTLDGAALYMPQGYFATFKSFSSYDAPPEDRTPLLNDVIGTLAGSIIGGIYTDGTSGNIWFGFNEGAVVLHSPYKTDSNIEDIYIHPNPAIADRGILPQIYIGNVPADSPLIIYDAAGNLVREIEFFWKGHDGVFHWDGKNEYGEPVASGVYFIVAPSQNGIAKGKLFIAR